MQVRERIGGAIGKLIAPAIAAVSRFRRARTFHPRGLVFTGRSEPIIGGAFANLGADLDGEILVRCSGALWKRQRASERFDVLGIAIRFPRHDLLFATIKSPFTMVFSPFTTNAHDFLANQFFAVAPFEVHHQDRVELRLVPIDPPVFEGARDEKLNAAVEAGECIWHLEARKTLTRHWHAVSRITFDAPADVDQEALHFDAFRTDGNLVPVGVVHAIRRAVYAASQNARPDHAR